MLICKLCKQRIENGQMFAEVNMVKLLKCSQDELSMDYPHDEDECILHKECFLATLNGCPVPDPQVEDTPEPVAAIPVQRTDPLEFFS